MMSLPIYCAVVLAINCIIFGVHGNQSDTSDCQPGAKCESDPLGYEAIKQLHALIDDDHNGNLDREESDEFFRDELKHEDGAASQATFHGSDDLISINDLWELWTVSEVYNWTVNEVIEWLVDDVNLPIYADSFRVNEVDGHILPRIAVNSQYVTSILGIKNPVHRQKLSLKATDLVLFGYKKKEQSWLKDILFVCLLGIALTVAWLAQSEKKQSQSHIRKVLAELESLQRSEERLKTLQRQYEETKRAHQETAMAKQNLEQKLEDEVIAAKNEAERLRQTREATEEELSRLKLAELELIEVRKALAEAERRLEMTTSELPQLLELQQWLQLTYEIETQYYEMKKEAAEKLLKMAREMCEKIRKKRSGLLGSLRVAHSSTLDDTDQSIMQARCALEEVRLHLQERNQRWQEIERICGFDIIHNPGLHVLETTLRGIGSTFLTESRLAKSSSMSTFSAMSAMPLDHDLDEDLNPSQLAAVGLLTASDTFGYYGTNTSMNNLSKMQQHHSAIGGSVNNLSKTCPTAVHPAMTSTDLQEKHRSLVEVLGGSTCISMKKQRSLPSKHLLSDTADMPQKKDGVMWSGEESDTVMFSLGDSKSSPQVSRRSGLVLSKGSEATDRTHLPKSLSMSDSDSSLHGYSDLIQNDNPLTKRTVNRSLDDTPTADEETNLLSSTDSLDFGGEGDNKNVKKSGLKNIFKSKKKKDS